MATWNDLPNEIRDMILRFVYFTSMMEFDELEVPEYQHLVGNSYQLRPPKSLSTFAYTIRTCRYFHYAMTNTIKWVIHDSEERMSTGTVLKHHQHWKLIQMSNTKPSEGMRHVYGSKLPLRILDLEELVQLIGFFWNNPIVLEELELTQFLSKVHIRNCFNDIYKLFENWAQRGPRPLHIPHVTFPIQFSPDSENLSALSFVSGSTYRNENGLIVCTIHQVLNTMGKDWSEPIDTASLASLEWDDGDYLKERIPLLDDIMYSPPDTWWLLVQDVNRVHTFYPRWYIWNSSTAKASYTLQSLTYFENLFVRKLETEPKSGKGLLPQLR